MGGQCVAFFKASLMRPSCGYRFSLTLGPDLRAQHLLGSELISFLRLQADGETKVPASRLGNVVCSGQEVSKAAEVSANTRHLLLCANRRNTLKCLSNKMRTA